MCAVFLLVRSQFSTLMFAKLIGFGADDAGARAGAKPCSSPDTWTEACGTNQEMAQAQALYKAAPQDAWGSTGGMPVWQNVVQASRTKLTWQSRTSYSVNASPVVFMAWSGWHRSPTYFPRD